MSTTPPTDQTRSLTLAVVGTLTHAGLVLGLFVVLIVFVPPAKRTFDEFGVTLPWVTQIVIRISNWVAEYWWTTVPVLLLLGACDFVLMAALSAHNRFGALVWLVSVALVLAALIALTQWAIESPITKLRE